MATLLSRGYFVEDVCIECEATFLRKPHDPRMHKLKLCPNCRAGVKDRLERYKMVTMDEIFKSLDQQNII